MDMPQSQYLPGTEQVIPCGHACEALDILQQIYQYAPVGMVVIDYNFDIIRINNYLVKILETTTEKALSNKLSAILPKSYNLIEPLIKDVMQNEQPISEEISLQINNIQKNWLISIHSGYEEESKLKFINLIIQDITELRLTQSDLKSAYKQIKKLKKQLQQENIYLKNEIAKSSNYGEIIGESRAIKSAIVKSEQVAKTDATVLITGETGTGKELFARAIHKSSNRQDKPLVIVNCAALPANLIESELFGHEKGSFTGAIGKKAGRFEIADGGTIFLDEIGELPLDLQSKLLRVLQEHYIERVGGTKSIKINVRILAATNRDLLAEVRKGTFREDLYYRLNVFPIHIPPLRERIEDIPAIVKSMVFRLSENLGKKITHINESSLETMKLCKWQGNIRELQNIVERSIILCNDNILNIQLPEQGKITKVNQGDISISNQELLPLKDYEKNYILKVLEHAKWRIRGSNGAAEILDMKPTTLESRMKKLNIKRK